jgi:uncharacterized protein
VTPCYALHALSPDVDHAFGLWPPFTAVNPYYIYALKDPRTSPAQPFYIGKGTGSRAWDHTLRVDDSRKGQRIRDIEQGGLTVLTTVLADGLTEVQALKLESELIAAFGTEVSGGPLTNVVMPSGDVPRPRARVVVPSGVVEKAQIGLGLLKSAVLELARANADGVTNADVCKALGLQSDYLGGSKDYLSFSLLGLLMREGKVARNEKRKHIALVR